MPTSSSLFPSGLPTAAPNDFDPPGELRAAPSISRLTYPDGHEGWLVTGHATARAVSADRRFSSRQELRRWPVETAMTQERQEPAAPGIMTRHDPPDHTRYRKLLTGQFTVRRVKLFEPGAGLRAADPVVGDLRPVRCALSSGQRCIGVGRAWPGRRRRAQPGPDETALLKAIF
ncbi:cytochrome P450 family protein [Microlunatus parietis]|uniref:Cytochrome P450 n=1 Tax=Microlunatus parietis TaxID=682979 RepID=A0A7Y9I4S6_9ACTN|nr:hypothetical protein [Microlunatus parietis]NYE70088.1 cytochrome P450 [Microlunatus parietis]